VKDRPAAAKGWVHVFPYCDRSAVIPGQNRKPTPNAIPIARTIGPVLRTVTAALGRGGGLCATVSLPAVNPAIIRAKNRPQLVAYARIRACPQVPID